jgi:3',5'-cyclic AMP phosphodiesterase CpdA
MRRIAHVSDLHFGTEGPAVVAELRASLAAFAPDLLVVSGDLTQRARRHEFEGARSFLQGLALPYLSVPGNHDIAPLYYPLARILDPYARYRRYVSRELDGFWHSPELLVLGISSVQPRRWKEGTVSERQLAWLEKTCAEHPAQLRMLVTHHPLVQAGTPTPTRLLSRHASLLRALDTADIAVCLSGHLHQSFSGLALDPIDEPVSVLAVHASTATSRRLRGHANAYNRLSIDGTTVHVEVVGFDGQHFQALSRARYERDAQGAWRPSPARGPLADESTTDNA